MPIVRTSKQPSRRSKPLSRSVSGTTKFGRELVKSVEQATAFIKGEIRLRSYRYNVPDRIDVRAIRRRQGLSQAEFAGRYALNRRTIQEWEQGRAEPDSTIRAYLTVIDRDPNAVERALAGPVNAS